MTPLNAILNVTDVLQDMLYEDVMNGIVEDLQKVPASSASSGNINFVQILSRVNEDNKKLYDYSRLIWSSAQVMQLMLQSQMSHTRINTNQLICSFEPLSQSMSEMLIDFLPPFFHSLEQKKIQVEVAEANLIPQWACSDWNLYKQILFHVLQNAIKFNKENGEIRIVVSFHSFEEEFRL